MINNDLNKVKHMLKGARYVIQSTLNQAVNYIPAVLFEFSNIVNITIYADAEKKNTNLQWDEYLKKVLEEKFKSHLEFEPVPIHKVDINDLENIITSLECKLKDEQKIFWNITGGQRFILLAIYQYIKRHPDKHHYIGYLEGNTGKMVILDGNFIQLANLNYNINKNDFNITTTLSLMGFETNNLQDRRNLMNLFSEEEKSFFEKVSKKYFSIHESDFRTQLIKSKGNCDDFKKKLNIPEFGSFNFEEYHGKNNYKLGYLIEDIAACQIYNNVELMSHILDLRTSVKICPASEDMNRITDEFDILILSKYGQLINIECKSGGMTGDVAKSTNYSTYAIAGVYGKPVLVTPLLKEDLGRNYYGDENIKRAKNAADRANLDCWGINELDSQLEQMLIK